MLLDERFIRKTYEIANLSAAKGFDPFGALLVKDNQVVFSSEDKCIVYSDPTAHAELILISEYCRTNQIIDLTGYTLYCNVEPCVMCSGAIHWSKISKVVFGVHQSALQTVSKGKTKPSCEQLINIGNKSIEVVGGILEDEGIQLLKRHPFTSKKQKHKAHYKK